MIPRHLQTIHPMFADLTNPCLYCMIVCGTNSCMSTMYVMQCVWFIILAHLQTIPPVQSLEYWLSVYNHSLAAEIDQYEM